MQLQQIAPHTLVTDGPADTARSAHPAPGGEAFGSVFSKEAAGQRPGPTADAPGGAGTGPGYAGQDSRTTTDAENASPAQGRPGR